MADDSRKSYEGRVLDRYQGIREAAAASEEFAAWRDSLTVVVIDDELFYLRGGDMLKDEDQIIFEWARRSGLLPDELLDRGGL